MSTKNYYVSMTDKFMSGWGLAANKTNKLIIECENYSQAVQIEQAARRRSEMKYINICIRKPRYNNNTLVSHKHYNDLSGDWKK